MENNCSLSTGACCCNCGNHYEDFHHCCTTGQNGDGCVCSKHKGWICMVSFEGEEPRAHSGWSEHGECEMYYPKQKRKID
jgi:hypothetical protein